MLPLPSKSHWKRLIAALVVGVGVKRMLMGALPLDGVKLKSDWIGEAGVPLTVQKSLLGSKACERLWRNVAVSTLVAVAPVATSPKLSVRNVSMTLLHPTS
jgi:hypothetical protein